MNSIVSNPAETEPDIRCMTTETASEDIYSTTPLMMRSIYRQPNEEELHSSFEEAISDRVLALNKQFRHLSFPLTDSLSKQSPVSSVVRRQRLPAYFAFLRHTSRRAILFIAMAFMLVMIGFDLMGLLVLLRLP